MRLLIIIAFILIQTSLHAQQGGMSAFIALPSVAQQIREAPTEDEVLSIYRKFQDDFPDDKFAQVHVLLDQVHVSAAERLIAWKNPSVMEYILKIRQVQDRSRLLEALPVEIWQHISIDSLLRSRLEMIDKDSPDYDRERLIYAELLTYSGKDQQALDFMVQQQDTDRLQTLHPYLFIRMYQRNDCAHLAVPILANIIRKGEGKPDAKALLRDLWAQSNRDERDFQQYYEDQLQALRDSMATGLTDRLVSYPAPEFSLQNLQGETVTLAELRGKVIFLDFWATWCGPCLASFPAMQRVVDAYRDQDDVVFLFVNTLERGDDPQERIHEIKKLFQQKSWDLPVIVDAKVGGQYELVKKYKVNGIPAQFLIDKHGQVRHVSKGFTGSADGLIQEINLLIQHVRTR